MDDYFAVKGMIKRNLYTTFGFRPKINYFKIYNGKPVERLVEKFYKEIEKELVTQGWKPKFSKIKKNFKDKLIHQEYLTDELI